MEQIKYYIIISCLTRNVNLLKGRFFLKIDIRVALIYVKDLVNENEIKPIEKITKLLK